MKCGMWDDQGWGWGVKVVPETGTETVIIAVRCAFKVHIVDCSSRLNS